MWHVLGTGRLYRGLWCEDLKKDHLEDLGVDGRIILKRIDVAQNKVTWRALMRTIINLWVPYNAGNLLNSFRRNILSRLTLLHGFNQSVS